MAEGALGVWKEFAGGRDRACSKQSNRRCRLWILLSDYPDVYERERESFNSNKRG